MVHALASASLKFCFGKNSLSTFCNGTVLILVNRIRYAKSTGTFFFFKVPQS
jgi:hypothetical protein